MANQTTSSLTGHLTLPHSLHWAKLFRRRLIAQFKRTARRRRTIRLTLLVGNVIVLAVIALLVVQNAKSGAAVKPVTLEGSAALNPAVANPLDQLSSADIALTVAQLSDLPETTAVANQAQSQAANLAIISNSDDVLTKPQVVATALKSRADIQDYVTQAGDTVASLAAKFGVTSNSILWSNGLSGNALAAGVHLVIPPVNGIVYTIKAGDTPASLAQKYDAGESQIVAYNDAEISGLQVGEQIIIPNATMPVSTPSHASFSAGFPWGSGPIYGYNGYDFGFCTWFVATQISVPSNWGNASSWAYYARLSGWNVSSAPQVGAIAQTPYAAGGEGHVAVVDGVSADGSMIHVKDMNNYGDGGGFDRVGSAWVSASTYPNYITH